MEQIVGFFTSNERWIYVALGVFAIWHIIKFSSAWNTLRSASFSMERELAQIKLNRAAIMLVLALLVAVSEFTLVSFLAPTMPGALPLPTPTLNILSIPTATLAPNQTGEAPTLAVTPTLFVNPMAGCIPDQVMISSPEDGAEVSGVIQVVGTANIPDFGFYKYEIARPGESIWLSINAGEQVVQNGVLGEWITSVLPPGDYQLRLMVADNQGKFKLPCAVQVRVIAPTPEP